MRGESIWEDNTRRAIGARNCARVIKVVAPISLPGMFYLYVGLC